MHEEHPARPVWSLPQRPGEPTETPRPALARPAEGATRQTQGSL